MTATERFWSLVEKHGADECWRWLGASSTHGYGTMTWNGRQTGAHRISVELATGRPPTAFVLHRCDTPWCVNPAHLFEGTQADNMRDCRDKGRLRVPASRNRTHCAQGHAFAEHGRWRAGRQCRVCLVCEKAHDRAKYVARQLAAGKTLRDPPEVMRNRSTRQDQVRVRA